MAASVTESWKLSIDKKSVGKYNSDQDIRKIRKKKQKTKKDFSVVIYEIVKANLNRRYLYTTVMVFYGLYATCLWGDEANERLL